MNRSYNPSLHWYATLLAVLTLFLIVAGGLVTSNDAGLSVPDWPLSFGQVMPEMVGGVFYEHGHRMIAASVGFLTVLLVLWLSLSEKRPWVRRLGWVALLAVIVQGLLGGLTVLLLLPPAVSVLHASLAQAFFCVVIVLAVVTSRGWQGSLFPLSRHLERPGFRLSLLVLGTVYIQLILGAVLRHTGMVGTSKGGEINHVALSVHILGAVVVTGVVFYAVLSLTRRARNRSSVRLSNLLFGLLAVQIMLGIGALLVRFSIPSRPYPLPAHVLVTTGHLAVGALMLAVAVLIALTLTQQKVEPARHAGTSPELAGEAL